MNYGTNCVVCKKSFYYEGSHTCNECNQKRLRKSFIESYANLHPISFGVLLFKERNRVDLTVQELADKTNLYFGAIEQYESGVKAPTEKAVNVIADIIFSVD